MRLLLQVATVCAISALMLCGCQKQESTESSTTTKSDSQQGLGQAASETLKTAVTVASNEVAKVAEAGKAAATQATQTVSNQVAAVSQVTQNLSNQVAATSAAATSQFDTLVQKAKGYLSDKKYQEALTVVQQISNLKLTAEQQKLYEDLKTQVQKALATQTSQDAATAVGNLLGGQKK